MVPKEKSSLVWQVRYPLIPVQGKYHIFLHFSLSCFMYSLKLIALDSSYCSTSLNESRRGRYFASAMDRAVLEDDLGVQAHQGDQRPDRIIGLATCNSAYAYPSGPQRGTDIHHQRVRELKLERGVHLSPFSNGDINLILPFVIFEAKRAYGTCWPELETQTGLPVAKLLRLQVNLQRAAGSTSSACNALLWMFGAIGSEWHVYGCYAVWYRDTKEWRFVSLQPFIIHVEAVRMLIFGLRKSCSWPLWIFVWKRRQYGC